MKFRKRQIQTISRACKGIVEQLERRQLFASNTIQTLPFVLEFDSDRGELLDKDGQGTGFTRVQENKNGNGYQSGLIDLDIANGVLKLTTTGTSSAGSNNNNDNTLVNALETQFNALASGFKITTRLKGPLSYINQPSEQAGIMFGPDQDNYVKLVAVSQPTGTFLQFIDEQTTGTTYNHALSANGANTLYNIGSFASISTLDLQLIGDPSAGTVNAYYSVNGGAFTKINKTLTLSGSFKTAFFNSAARAGIIAAAKNDLPAETMTFDRFRIDSGMSVSTNPYITAVRPTNTETNVARNAFVAADVFLPNSGIDPSTLTSATVKLYRTSDGAAVSAVINTTGGGDAIVLQPTALLAANTQYTFQVTTGVKDLNGASFAAFTSSFTTGTAGANTNTSIAFEKISLPSATGHAYTGVVIGPDGKLYASTDTGLIQRFTINADGTLGPAQNITSLTSAEGTNRLLLGMAFDPTSTASNLILWVTHGDVSQTNAADWSGKITKLAGANLQTVTDMVVNLPRSIRDHATNQLVFGPDGALYFCQATQSAMGAPDTAWGNRSEHLLNGAILRLDPSKLTGTPLDVKTDSGGTYNPFAANVPLTIYAGGVRNSYDLVWTSDGKLYAPTNGSAAGGNTPGTPSGSYSFDRIDGVYTGPNVPALNNVSETQNDYLFNIVAGGYYGQPNPVRGEFVLNGGNPTSGVDTNEVASYPVGTQADRNYRGSTFVFGKNYSPNGAIEYKGNAFGGALAGKILVTEYSGGDDIIVLTRGANGDIVSYERGLNGLTGFVDPLDIIENPTNGFMYVAEYGGQRLTLVRPITPGGHATSSKPQMVFNDVNTSGSSAAQKITITNSGTQPLALPSDGLTITGTDAARFTITQKPTLPLSLAPGESIDVYITFTTNSVGAIKFANLQIKSNDADNPIINVALRGLGTAGTGGANEPSLQKILDLYNIPINVGDSNPADVYLTDPPVSPNDEIVMSTLVKAGTGPVTIEPIASFGVGHATYPTTRLGYYTPGSRFDRNELFTISGTGAATQTVNPTLNGMTTFDPGTKAFGLYALWPSMQTINGVAGGTEVYSEDRLNQIFDPNSSRKVRFYALKTSSGVVVPNAFVFAFEEFNGGYDNQDFVGIIRNVQVAPAGAEIGFENADGVPFSDRLVFNRIQIQPPRPVTDPTTGVVTQPPNNVVHDLATVIVRNTGTSPLVISSMSISAGWVIENTPSSFTIDPGGSQAVNVRFTATSGGLRTGSLVFNSNDSDEPAASVQLAGFWEKWSEEVEPTLPQLVQAFGYSTSITKSGQLLAHGGLVERIGDEVLSGLWKRADASRSVNVRQLAAFHTQGNSAQIQYYTVNSSGTTTRTTLFSHDGVDAQSLLPHILGGTGPAQGSFNPSGNFGFRLDGEWSEDFRNPQEQPGGNYGHHVRFFVAKDRDGKVIPDTYIMVMDYQAINYDYQDNVYLVTNIKPVSPPAMPSGLTATGNANGISLNWPDSTEGNLAGYNVYRAASAGGTYTKINTALLTTSDFIDATAPVGTSYYSVTAVDLSGNESGGSSAASATRGADTTPPAVPTNLATTGSVSGITLTWNNNLDADFAGYNIFRSSSVGGSYTKLNTSALLTSASFFDSTAPSNVVSYYTVTAVDVSGNESTGSNVASATRAADTTAPTQPSGLGFTTAGSGITIDWSNNSESDLAGYNIYRSDAADGTFTKLNTSGLLSASNFVDTTAPTGATSYYKVTAVDTTGNESSAATGNAFRPVTDTTPPSTPTGLGATANGSGISLDWLDNFESDLLGYNVYRSSSLNGTYVKLNGGALLNSNYTDSTAPGGATSYYRVTAVDNSGNESDFASANATRATSFASVDINSTPTGSTNVITDGSAYDLLAGGSDIWGTADSMRFLYESVSGDFDVKVRLAGLSNSSAQAKAGLMARESLIAGSRNAFVRAAPGADGERFSYRGSTNGTTTSTGSGAVSYPNTWLRLTRVGNVFTGYRSTDGMNWTSLGSQTLAMPTTVFLGMAATSHNTSALTTAQFRDFSGTTSNNPPPVDNPPAAPTGLTGNGSQGGISLDWANNSEADLAGYNVYRATSAGGTYTKLNGSIINVSNFLDSTAAPGATSFYRITAVDLGGNESAVASINVDRPPLDGPAFVSNDIGGATPAGSTTVVTDGKDYNIAGGGSDVWNKSDQFRYVSHEVTGDFDIKVQVTSLTNTNLNAKAGLMARESLDANSKQVFMHVMPSGYRMSYRGTTGGNTTGLGSGSASFPNVWVRLVRVGNVFTGYMSTNGTTWTMTGQVTVAMSSTINIGMAVNSKNTSQLSTATFRNLQEN